MPSRRRKGVDPLTLHPGDYIVHDQHGIGRFIELVSRTIGRGDAASTRDYLVIEYAPAKRGGAPDRLFVPSDQLDLISNYVGGENPSLLGRISTGSPLDSLPPAQGEIHLRSGRGNRGNLRTRRLV